MLVKHFQGVAKENFSGTEPFIKNLIKHIPKRVSREDNCNLNRPVTEKDISEVLKEMQNGKAPGPLDLMWIYSKPAGILLKGIL